MSRLREQLGPIPATDDARQSLKNYGLTRLPTGGSARPTRPCCVMALASASRA